MTEKEVLKAPKTFCLHEYGETPECIICGKLMKPGRFYITSKSEPKKLADYRLVEGYVCPKCAAKRIVASGRRALLTSLAFSIIMLIAAWIVMDPLKVYVQKIYIPLVIVMFAAVAAFLVLGFYMMGKRSGEAKKARGTDDWDGLLMKEFAASDKKKRYYHREPDVG